VDGLYTADPNQSPDARFIPIVESIDQEILALAGETPSTVGIGGMITKIHAAQTAAQSGTTTVIVNGRTLDVISRVLRGEEIGTLFLPKEDTLNCKRCWIAFRLKPRGAITVDEGAYKALTVMKKSLLPSGITGVSGDFDAGESVSIVATDGKEFARGLVNYSASEIMRIKGVRSKLIDQILGYCTAEEVVHRDNLAILDGIILSRGGT
jgi:glutamate 5-kinase